MGTLYRRFPTKDALVDAVFEDTLAAIELAARDALAADDPWAGFCAFLDCAFALHEENRGLKDVMMTRSDRPRGRRERACAPAAADRHDRRPRAGGRLAALRLPDRGHSRPLLGRRPRDRGDRRGRARRLAPPPRRSSSTASAPRQPRRSRAPHSPAANSTAPPRAPGGTHDRRTAQRARPRPEDDLRRADARHVPGRPRPDDRLDGAADDRVRPARREPPLLGRHRVPDRLDRLDADLREARRHDGPQAALPGGDRHLPRRLDAGRAEPVDAPADRVPRPAGRRRRRPHGRRAGDHRGHRPAPRPRQVHGADRLGLRRRLGRRAAARRLPRRQLLLALDLLRQPADRPARGRHRRGAAPSACAPPAPQDRRPRRGASSPPECRR